MTIARRMAANAATGFVSQGFLAVLGLTATAVFVRTLGAERFGVWSLVVAAVAYLGLLDLGLGVALVRRLADADDDPDRRATATRALGAATLVTTVVGLLGALLLLVGAPVLGGWLRVEGAALDEFVAALRAGGVAVAFTLPGVALGAVPTARQRLDLVIRLEAAVTALATVAQVVLVLGGHGVVAMAWALVAGRAASLAGRVWLARPLLAHVRWGESVGYPFWQELGRFGALKVVHQLASQVVLYLDRVLVGLLVSVEAVAYYTVALELAQRLLIVQANVSVAFYPAACAAAGDGAVLRRLYVRTSRLVTALTLPLAIGVALFAGPVLRLWVGAPFESAAADILRIAALAYGAMALTAIPAGAADALNRPGVAARYGIAGVAINAALALTLIPPLGAVGAAWAIAGNVALQSPWFVRRVTRDLVGVPFGGYVREALAEPLLPALACGGVLAAAMVAGAGRSLPGLLIAATLGAVAFLLSVRLLRLFDDAERGALAGLPVGRVVRWVVGA